MPNKFTLEQISRAETQIKTLQMEIDHRTADYTVEHLVRRLDANDFFIPDYQRKFIWRPKNKSLFIESVLLGLPIPFMFFAECPDGRLEIVDGAQRMQTLHEFRNNALKLKGLQKLTCLNNFKFSDLPQSVRRKFDNISFRVIILDEKTTDEARQDLFNRINTSGVKANDSEVRRGSMSGRLTDFIDECCANPDFIELCPVNKKKEDRQERFELILRFFAYLYNYQEFVHDVGPFLDNFLRIHLDNFDEEMYKADFENMLKFVRNNFEWGFGKSANATVTPRVRFEALAVGTGLALKEKPDLQVSNVDWIRSPEFSEHTTTDASNNQGRLRGRVEYVRDRLLEAAIN